MPSGASVPLRVLIVDDNRTVANTLALLVQFRGYTPHAAYSAAEVIATAGKIQPQAAIVAVMMHGVDGIELATWLREHHPTCELLLVSGHPATADELSRIPHVRGRPIPLLAKPVLPAEIFDFLAESERHHSRSQDTAQRP